MGLSTVLSVTGLASDLPDGDLMPPSSIIEETMQEILSRPEFQDSGDAFIQRLLKWLGEWWDGLNVGDFFNTPSFSLASFIVWGVTAMLLGIILFLVVLGLSRLIGRNPRIVRKKARSHYDEMSFKVALSRVQQYSEAGDFTSAVKWLFFGFLWLLQEKSYLSIRESKTNRQYLLELRRNQCPHLALFQALTDLFNQIRYGGRTARQDEYICWLEHLKALQEGEQGNETQP